MFLWACVATAFHDPAGAQSSETEEALIGSGVRLRREGRDAEALAEFERAHELHRSARAMAQIALAKQALGRIVDAERDLTQALSEENDPWIASRRGILEAALEGMRKRLGYLQVATNARSAELWVDGAFVGVLPLDPLRVPAGPVDLEVRTVAHGAHGRVSRTAAVPAGGTAVEYVHFVGQASETDYPLQEPRSEQPSPAPVRFPTRGARSARRFQASLGHAFMGAAGAALGTALAAQLLQQRNVARYNDDQHCYFGGISRDARCGHYRTAAAAAQRLATVGYVATTALGAAASILLLTLPNDSHVLVALSGQDLRATLRLRLGGHF